MVSLNLPKEDERSNPLGAVQSIQTDIIPLVKFINMMVPYTLTIHFDKDESFPETDLRFDGVEEIDMRLDRADIK